MTEVRHLGAQELQNGLEHILAAPAAAGTVEMIVRRPQVDAREMLAEGELDLDVFADPEAGLEYESEARSL